MSETATATECLSLLEEAVEEVAPGSSALRHRETAAPTLAYVADIARFLCELKSWSKEVWRDSVVAYLEGVDASHWEAVGARFKALCEARFKEKALDTWGEDEDPELKTACDVEFSLAYGGKLLLHNTRLFLKCGRRYGICGKNGVGKTTLMRNVANGKIEGFDPGLCAVYVESHADDEGDEGELPVQEWVMRRPQLAARGKVDDPSDALSLLRGVKFSDELLGAPVSSLSGGWRMKLSLVVAALMDADILLLDEPTNHLDHKSVQWLTQYLKTCRACCMIVSHDTKFLDDVCTDIVHYENKKLVRYRGNLSMFVEKVPAAMSYYKLEDTHVKFAFPQPGRLEGINTTTKAVLRLDGATFTWPGRDVPTLSDVNVKLSLGSRVVVLGANGAGKSTLIKLIVGENGPDNGECLWRHHNLRIAYVAQHSFHHIEEHLDESPVNYLQWRFGKIIDLEYLNQRLAELKRRNEIRGFEKAPDARPLPFSFEKIMGRREKAGVIEYEVKFVDRPERQNLYIDKDRLDAVGLTRQTIEFDMLVAARAAGIDLIPCTTTELQAHLDEFQLPREFGTYGRIRGLSGGQKVKLVLAAAMWNRPHVLILDEPTNYLDRDSLGALANSIRDFGGGVIMISHAEEFYKPLCNETWWVKDGEVAVSGEAANKELKVGKKKRATKAKEEQKSTGSTNEEIKIVVPKDFWGKSLSKKDARSYEKAAKKRDVALMRKILQVPRGKTMPGAPELGDGSVDGS
ncbi:hypothetical protein CTAYLR_002218 [Chrysophaeum taylorii]|uniref:ABC transporter domain-containing protein n=1 Tax=Chrysophaeum taylorii TaxID=2483200 RepID=A0AAD7UNF9_9STRA|nr:hypothetical protein CTAYLR_002218 [Chrysophaeum taylorii]